MSDPKDHPHHHPPDAPGQGDRHAHSHPDTPAAPPDTEADGADDARSQALSDALRSSFVIVKLVMILLVLLFLGSGIFTVGSQEKAVILRFGRPVGQGEQALLGAGLHFAFPYPIDEVIKIPVTEVQSVDSTVGWYAVAPEYAASNVEPPMGRTLNPAIDGYTLTGDGNIIHVKSTLRYRITEPLDFFFGFVTASNVVQNALNNALFYVSAGDSVDAALRQDVAGFKERIIARVRELLQRERVGVAVDDLVLTAIPPRQVKEAFNEALAAENDRSKAINDAQGQANKLLAEARGGATAIVNAGQRDRNRLVQDVQGEVDSFKAQLPRYRSNPDLFVRRLQVETAQRVLTNAQDKIVVPGRADGKPRELRLLLTPEPRMPATVSTNRP